MHPTPSLSHLTANDFLHVYEPAEDTFLFLDALEADRQFIAQRQPQVCLEVGSGSGCVITFFGSLFGSCQLFATDVNVRAAAATAATGRRNGQRIEVVRADLVAGLVARLAGQVDVLLFNPPYVVTESSEVGSTGISAAWAGGLDGREVTDRLLGDIPRLLSPRGCCYMVVIPENKPEAMAAQLSLHGLEAHTVLARRAGRERLAIWRFARPDGGDKDG